MPYTFLDRIRANLRDASGSWYAIEVACKAALDAGKTAIRRHEHEAMSQEQRFAFALQAAIETLEGIELELAENETRPEG